MQQRRAGLGLQQRRDGSVAAEVLGVVPGVGLVYCLVYVGCWVSSFSLFWVLWWVDYVGIHVF